MIKDMYSVIQRINEIKNRFGLKRYNHAHNTNNNFDNETTKRLRENKTNNDLSKIQVSKNQKLSVPQIKNIVKSYSKQIGVPPSLVNAIIEKESGYNQYAVSKKGARGLMQLMPGVMREMGISNPFIPEENIRGGISHLKRLLVKYEGDYKKALAAYNAGEKSVDENKGVPPYKETKDYIIKVINAYLRNSE